MQAYYHSIEEFGTVDGRGIRFVLFLAGCGLGCAFCHNPDTWERGRRQISIEQVLACYGEYKEFYQASGGGITVSGGEPLQQADFVAALFKACQELGIHTTLDTSGYAPRFALTQVLPYTEELLFCLKASCESKYKYLTNAGMADILKNLEYAVKLTSSTVRYVVIPDVNDRPEDICALAGIMHRLPNAKLELLPYHNLGMSKWQELGWKYKLAAVRQANSVDIERMTARLLELGVPRTAIANLVK